MKKVLESKKEVRFFHPNKISQGLRRLRILFTLCGLSVATLNPKTLRTNNSQLTILSLNSQYLVPTSRNGTLLCVALKLNDGNHGDSNYDNLLQVLH